MCVNKSDLVDVLAVRTGFTKKQSEIFLNAFIDEVTRALVAEDNVVLVGFGSFKLSYRKARTCRNPKNGKVIDVPAQSVPTFKAGKPFKDLVNSH